MPFSKFIVIPIFIAFQAFTMMFIASFRIPGTNDLVMEGGGLMAWIAFQAWAMYFLAGCTPKMGAKVFAGYFGGIVASVAIFELAGQLGKVFPEGSPWGLYLAVFIVVIVVISMERVPGFDFVPSYFIGAGVFFGLMSHVTKPDDLSIYVWYKDLAVPELIACAVGLIYGWITVTCRVRYTAMVTPEAAEGEAAPAAD